MSDTVSVDTNFVVYAYMREDGTPYYIGKGRPERPYKNRGRACSKPSDKSRIIILHENIDEQTAFKIEIELIAKYKRKDLYPEEGLLHNKTNGGEGPSGSIKTPEQRKIISEKLSGSNNVNYGKKLSEETKNKISESTRGVKHHMYGKRGPKHHAYGKPCSEECLEKISLFFDWYHKEHGEVLRVSSSRLPLKFPDQNLDHSSLSKVAKGVYFSHKGWVLLKNKDLKLKRVVKNRKRGKSYDWIHPIYGVLTDTSCPELSRKYPELSLEMSRLYKVATGKGKSYKGWKLLKNKDMANKQENHILRDWIHKDHGEVLQVSATNLVKMFPYQKLSQSALCQVALGRHLQHKGWKNLNPSQT